MKKNKGLTLMELTIVLALIVIVAAILIPLFLLTTDRARLRGDIQSARVIQNARDLYRVERGTPVDGIDVAEMVENLANAGYLNPRDIGVNPQTYEIGARWVIHEGIVKIDIRNIPELLELLDTLSPEEREYVLAN